MVKKVVRMMMRKLKNQKLPVFQREEAVLIMESACYTINEVPYAADGESLFLSPNDILVLSFQLDSLASAESSAPSYLRILVPPPPSKSVRNSNTILL